MRLIPEYQKELGIEYIRRGETEHLKEGLRAFGFGSLIIGANLQQAIEQFDKSPLVAILMGVTSATGILVFAYGNIPDIYTYLRKYHADSRIICALERFRKDKP